MNVVAAWPGVVREIHVSVGDVVEPEQELFTLESMKMFQSVVAPAGGRIAKIDVAVDQFVNVGDSLGSIE